MNRRVLIVDEDARVLDVIRKLIYSTCYIATAKSGEEALDRLANDTDMAVVVSNYR